MGLVLEIGDKLRKIVLISYRICYRSVCNHPFLAGMLPFLLFLYRSFPFLFALLVSTSPVLVCTAVLLGTLLSFGQTNIPEIEREEKVTCDDVASLRTRGLGDDTVVLERGGSFSAEMFVGETRDFVDASIQKASSEVEDRDGLGVYVPLISEDLQNTDSEKRVNEDCDGSVVYVPLIDQGLQDIGGEKREIGDAERELDSSELGERRKIDNDHLGIEGIDWDVAAVDQQYTFFQKVQDEIRRVEDDDISPRGSGYAHEGDHLYSSLLGNGGSDDEAVEQQYTSFQKVRNEIRRVEDDDISPRGSGYAHDGDHLYSSLHRSGGDDEAGEDVDDEASDSESDRAESSSPDASMADILPMLDELHPLLDSEAPQPAHVSHGHESDAASDQSNRSNAGSVESDVETENHGGEVGEDGNDYNDGDKEEAPDGKDDESKSAIKWTEDDQKNLMDLGNLELERNRRLENLIARRRARKSSAEKNLIDFDSVDLPFNVAPISTARHNPFDLPYDSFDNLGLPPIPGSAPSVMLPRRNPFDLPYESNEEKPDLKGDPFEQEFMPIHAKDAIFRRHESFSSGPSTLGQPRQARQDFKWRPVFVPERLASDGTSSSLFQRQLSEVSESKLSSVPDTESVSSAADLNERNFSEQDFTKEAEVISNIYHATDDLVEHGSQSSEDVDSLEMEQGGKRDVQHIELEIKLVESQDLEPSLSGATGLATHVEHVNEDHFKPEPIEEDNSSTSSLSSLTEEDEKIADVVEGGSTSLEARGDIAKEFVISPQPSLKESEVQFMSRTLNEDEHDEPVYDSTPLPTEKILSFNSISSDIQADVSEMFTPPALAEVQVSFVDRGCEVYGESTDKDTSGFVETSGATSKVHASDEIEGSLGTGNQVGLSVSHSEDDISLPKIFDMKTADCSYQSVLSEEQSSSELDKVLSWSDKSMVEPYLDDHVEALIIKEEVDDIKEIDAGLLSELDAVGDFSANEVVGEALHTEELIPEEANVLSTEFGDLNLSELSQELPVVEARSIENIDTDFKQIHKGLAVEEFVLPSVVDDQLVVEAFKNTVQTSSELPIVEERYLEASVNAVQTSSELPIVEASYLEDNVTDLKEDSEGNVNERYLEASVNAVQTSSELPIVEASYLEDNVTDLKQDSEGNVNELPQVSEDNNGGDLSNGSEEVETTGVDSTEVVATSNTLSSVQEDINVDTALEQVLESHEATSISNGGSEEVQCNAVGSLDEMASSNVLSGFQEENITTPKQVSDSHVNDVSEVGTGAIGSTEDIASSNTVSSVQEDTNADTALEQVSESHVDELPEATSISDDASEEVGTGAISSTEAVSSSNSVQEDINADTALEQVSESHVTELPKVMSISNDGFEGGTDAVGPAEEIASSNMLSSVHEDIATPKHISESHVNDGAEEIGTNSMGSTEEIASSDILSSVQEKSTLKQVSENHVDELLKPTSHLKERLSELGINAMASTEEIASSTSEHGVQETINSPIAFEQVSGSNADGEPPKPSTQNVLAEVVPHATDLPVENIKHEN